MPRRRRRATAATARPGELRRRAAAPAFLTLPAALLALAAPAAAAVAADCPEGAGEAVAALVSAVGDVRVNGQPPRGELPAGVVCAGDTVTVGARSRAGLYLLGADTPLRLDENTTGRFQPAEAGSGLIELTRGALYFLSEVRRSLTIRTPYVTAGVDGTEVYLRVADGGPPGARPSTEVIVLQGRVRLGPGSAGDAAPGSAPAATGDRVRVDAAGRTERGTIPGDGPYGALRRIAVGQLSWTLFYPDVLPGIEAAADPRLAQAAGLLAAGQVDAAEAALATIAGPGEAAGLRDALRTTIAVARKDTTAAAALSALAAQEAPERAAPQLARSFALQLALDLDGALAAAERAAELAPRSPLPSARVAELRLTRGETRAARRAAARAVELGGGALGDVVQGFADLAGLRAGTAEAAFRRAIAAESQNPLALLGLGLALIRQGDVEEGRRQIENAAVHDPSSGLLRTYLGRAYFQERRDDRAGKQYAIAKELDPREPTPWFFDAIRKQLDNRPVEALRDFERSIALNDDRAPFRSRALLERDEAVRGASLARIYQDLGFRQLGVNAAGRALATEPGESAAHRFLADLYQGEPRLEVARVSELLQAQLLQPVGLNPVQPSLAFTDLNVVGAAGPAQVSFNEFTPAFQSDGWQVTGTGVLGTQNTRAAETTATVLQGRTSVSLGQYFYDTDGFRENDDLQHRIYTLFGQTQATDNLNLQAEFRRRESNLGDRSWNFDPDVFDPTLDQSIDQDVFRAGARYRMSPAWSALASAAYSDRDERGANDQSGDLGGGDLFTVNNRDRTEIDGKQLEGQLIGALGPTKVVAGAGAYRVNRDDQRVQTATFQGQQLTAELNGDPHTNVDSNNVYAYTFTRWPEGSVWTVGLGLEETDAQGDKRTEVTPKLGLQQRVTDAVTFRAAAFRNVKRELVAQQTVEPTMVAGFNQLYDDFNGTKADVVAAGLDVDVTPDVAVGIEAMHRRLSAPLFFVDQDDPDVDINDARESTAQGYLYWTPTDRWAVGVRLLGVRFTQDQKSGDSTPSEIDSWLVPASVRYFAPNGVFVAAGVSYLNQNVTFQAGSGERDERADAWLLDAAVGYRLPRRRGILSVEANNLLGEDFKWQDDSFRTSEPQNRRFMPDRSAFVRFTLNF